MALHLRFALNLDTVANEMIDEVSRVWKSPFDAPTLVFPEYKLEQWFRFKWMERRGVLANLNKKTIDRFLFEILGGDDRKVKKLSPDMLRNVIIAYLRNLAAEGFDALRAKLSDRVAKYLSVGGENGQQVDEYRLFDFANKLSGLFLEYEISRPSQFIRNASGEWAPGILDRWKQGALQPFFCKDGKPVENEEWERDLYSAIFHNVDGKSLLTEVFEKMDGDCSYLTLPFLYEACKENGIPKFHFESDKPVFIFGLSGMGQFYRVVLQEFSKSHEVYAYIQNPCMEFWEDLQGKKITDLNPVLHPDDSPDAESDDVAANENDLLRAWGFAGRDGIKLWSLADDYRNGFSDAGPYRSERKKYGRENETLLHEIQRMIASRTNKFSENFKLRRTNPGEPFSALEDKSLTITAAPSRIREVEAVHSQICQLLDSGANIRDILVVCPRLSDYRPAICQVFDQCETGTENGVRLPFAFVDSAARESFVGNALEKLFAIKKNRSLGRVEFFSLVRNPVVQAVREISPEEISNWESWISGMNVYRDHTADSNKREDWLCGVKRLLFARLTDACVADEYLPYAEMSSAVDSSLDRFVEAVESLENWIRNDAAPPENGMNEVRRFLNSWLLMPNAPNGLAGESIVWEKVLKALDGLNVQFAAGVGEIPWSIVGQTLLSAAQVSEYSCGSVLVGGITFMKFAPNRTIPVKHLFFMGANAKDFSGEKSFDSLDLRKSVARWPGDDTAVAKNRYAFLCQLMSTGESFHISYQNMYLPKDAELYPSSVVNDLRKALANALPKEEKIENLLPTIALKIDEDRPNRELFTARERRNKRTIGEFDKSDKVPPSNVEKSSDEKLPERVSAYGIRKFLEDPFEFQIDRVMRMEETEENSEKIELEPISLNSLDKSVWLRALVAEKLGISSEAGKEMDKDLLLKKGILPQGAFGDRIWKELDAKASKFAEEISKAFPKSEFKAEKLDVPVKNADSEWTLFGTIRMMADDGKGNALVLDVKASEAGAENLIPGYVVALGKIAKENCKTVKVETFYLKNENVESESVVISVGPEEAKRRLNKIYEGMYGGSKNWKVIPVKLPEENSKGKKFGTLREYCKEVRDKWKFFAAKDLFDMRNLQWAGFDENDFLSEWRSSRAEMEKLMPEIVEKLTKKKNSKKGDK